MPDLTARARERATVDLKTHAAFVRSRRRMVSDTASLLRALADDRERLLAEVERLKAERHLLAMLAAETPRFYNPLHVMAAEQLRDQVLAEALARKGA